MRIAFALGTSAALLAIAPLALERAGSEAQVGTLDLPIERAIKALESAPDPAWLAWRVPMVDGDRDICPTWSDGRLTTRGLHLEQGAPGPQPASAASASGAGTAALEAGTNLVVLARVVSGRVERLRAVTGDCTIDAGGRRLSWLSGITSAASVRFLESFTMPAAMDREFGRQFSSVAIMALALHRDDAADVVLDRLVGQASDTHARGLAASWTARARGRRGFERLRVLLGTGNDPALRRTLASAITETREPDTLATLLAIARGDADDQVRAEAVAGYAYLAPDEAVDQVRSVLTSDASDVVRRRGVRGLARRPAASSIPILLDLARSSPHALVRTESVRALGQSSDPAAISYLTSLLTP